MMGKAWVVSFPMAVLFWLSLPLSCAAAQASWHGLLSNAERFDVAVARDASDWQALWGVIGREPPQALPQDRMAVAVFLGSRRTGGYRVGIVESATRGCLTIVRFTDRSPSGDAYVSKAFTAPWVLGLVPFSNKPVVFERSEDDGGPLFMPATESSRMAQMAEICGSERMP